MKMIEDIENCRAIQLQINNQNETFYNCYHNEIKNCFKYHNTRPKARKRLKRCTKRFWNYELTELWSNLCTKENIFIKARGYVRNIRKYEFKIAQNLFDKVYRRLDRRYNSDKIIEIENISITEPKQFWKAIYKIGSTSKKHIPTEVYN